MKDGLVIKTTKSMELKIGKITYVLSSKPSSTTTDGLMHKIEKLIARDLKQSIKKQ